LARAGLVAVGGAAGSVARYMVALFAAQRLSATFPWGTLIVNVLGCFLVGLLATLADEFAVLRPETRILLVIGFLGGFTTFSSFSLDALRLLEANELFRSALYFAGSIGLSFLAAIGGIAFARALGH
jgi:fluoride exporter